MLMGDDRKALFCHIVWEDQSQMSLWQNPFSYSKSVMDLKASDFQIRVVFTEASFLSIMVPGLHVSVT